MGVVVTFIIMTVLYLLIQAGILAYKKRYLMKLPYVYVKEVRLKRRVRKEIDEMLKRKTHAHN